MRVSLFRRPGSNEPARADRGPRGDGRSGPGIGRAAFMSVCSFCGRASDRLSDRAGPGAAVLVRARGEEQAVSAWAWCQSARYTEGIR